MKSFKRSLHGVARHGISLMCAALLVFALRAPLAGQEMPAPPQAPESQPAPQLSPDQLDDLVAPIALYPDGLLSQVLVASTYPLEIVQASQWLQQNQGLQGQALMDAARQQNWDPSVQALVAFPDVLSRLSSNVNWTTALGNAFLAQQGDVMSAVQQMRSRAQANGRLSSNADQTVTTQTQNGQTAIDIAPANPQVIYVPQYNPEYIWGPPVWGYYPPLYYPAISFGFGYGPGIYLGGFFGGWGGWGFGGWGGWGWGPNWFGGGIYQNVGFFSRYGFHNFYGGGIWAHNPYHRLGVAYPSAGLAQRFGGNYIGRGGAFHAGTGAGAQRGSFAGGQFRGGESFGRNAGGGQRFGSAGGASRGSASGGAQFRGGQSFSGGNGGWQHFGGESGAMRGGAAEGSRGFSGGYSRGSSQGFAGAGGGSYRSSPSYRQAPSNGGSGFRSSPSFGGSRNFSGAQRSFSGGSQSFSSGGSSRSFSGGGSRSFGGGGSRSFSGGGHSGGGHSGRR